MTAFASIADIRNIRSIAVPNFLLNLIINQIFGFADLKKVCDGPTSCPWRLKNPHEPEVQVGVGIMKTTVNTEPTPEELFKVRWISAAHATRSDRPA